MKNLFAIIIGIIIIVIAVFFLVLYFIDKNALAEINSFEECVLQGYPVMESHPRQCATPDGRTFTEVLAIDDLELEMVRIISPQPGSLVESPFEIKGEARGVWFWEAVFPVRLFDSEDNLLAQVSVEAEEEWMTEDFVSFSGLMEFDEPSTENGYLVFVKNNPSGLPEHDDEVRISVNFGYSFIDN